jgi:alpha-L-arabinofuranosidase
MIKSSFILKAFCVLGFISFMSSYESNPITGSDVLLINDTQENNETEYTVRLNESEKSPISTTLMGFNLVYAHETDAIWSGGKLTGYLNDISASVFRYPAGTVTTFYHWNALTGEGWKDSWDPLNPVIPKASTAFMDVDEFMTVIRNTNAMPLVGINMSSGRRWNRNQDGINEALALMQYLKDSDFPVVYYYLDNEPYMDDSNGGAKTIEEYAALVNMYADEMRKLDPGIKIIVNWRQAFKNRRSEYQKLFQIAGHNINVVDVHWYWNYSNSNMSEWLAKTPMVLWTGDTYFQEIEYFRQMTREFGNPDTELATLEWNTGAITSTQLTPHQCALVHSEMLLTYMSGGLDIATFWPLQWPNTNITLRTFYNRYNSTPQPNYNTFKFIGKLQGSKLIKTELIKSHPHMVIVAAHNEDEDVLRICILNKNATAVRVNIEASLWGSMVLEEAKSYILTGGGSGSDIVPLELQEHTTSGISVITSGISLNMLSFKRRATGNSSTHSDAIPKMTIYPNPARGFATIRLQNNEKGASVTLTNAAGMQQISKYIPAGQVVSVLDINKLKPGIYMVMCETEDAKIAKRLIISTLTY